MHSYGRQHITQDDIDAVVDTLRSDFLTQGPAIERFEQSVSSYCKAAYGVAVNSATSALHIACLALELEPGDSLWTSPITFVASANCALYCGAQVDFVDIDPQTLNLCPNALKKKLLQAQKSGSLPKIVVAVHFGGQSCRMDEIYDLSQRFGFRLIEDASHAIGAKYKGKPVGNCRFSDITVFSFHPVKIVTSGEGGMALTNDSDIAHRMRLLRSHCVTRDPLEMTGKAEGGWYYEQIGLGFNYRLTDIQAALGISQMLRVEDYVFRRNKLAANYTELLDSLPLLVQATHPDSYSSYHLFVIRLQLDKINKSKTTVFQELRDKGVGVNLHYIPVYLQPFYKAQGFSRGHCPEAERYYAEAITIPLYPELTHDDQKEIACILKEILCA